MKKIIPYFLFLAIQTALILGAWLYLNGVWQKPYQELQKEQAKLVFSMLTSIAADSVMSEDKAELEKIIFQLEQAGFHLNEIVFQNNKGKVIKKWQRRMIQDSKNKKPLTFVRDLKMDGIFYGRIKIVFPLEWQNPPNQEMKAIHQKVFTWLAILSGCFSLFFFVFTKKKSPQA